MRNQVCAWGVLSLSVFCSSFPAQQALGCQGRLRKIGGAEGEPLPGEIPPEKGRPGSRLRLDQHTEQPGSAETIIDHPEGKS